MPMLNHRNVGSLDIEELVEWELLSMDYKALEEYFIQHRYDFYTKNLADFKDMQRYMNSYKDTEVVIKVDSNE